MKKEYTPIVFKEKDLEPFTASNKLCPYKVDYHCYDDCRQAGCPGHQATCEYYHVTEGFSIDFGDGSHLSLDNTRMQIIADFIKRLTN